MSCLRPVETLSWLSAATSGLTRSATGARSPLEDATALSNCNSGSLSTLNCPMPASSATSISSALLPTPEKIMLSGAMPAASARRISPSETTSAPAPASAKVRITARLALAFTAKQMRAPSSAKASAKAV